MEPDNLSAQVKHLIDQLKVYINLRIDYARLHVAEFLIRFFSGMVLWLVVFLFLFFVLVFGSFAFAYWFGEITGKLWLGFVIIAGFYVFLALMIFLLRQSIIVRPFTKLVIKQMELDKMNEYNDEKKDE
jgi:hypothetical protein